MKPAQRPWLSKGICASAPELGTNEPSSANTKAKPNAITPPASQASRLAGPAKRAA